MTSEPQHIILAKARDKNSVAKLHQLYYGRVLRFLLYKFNGQITFEDAQDAYQEAIVAFWQNPMNIRASTDEQFFCWLKTVCTNYLIDLLKSANRRKNTPLPEDKDLEQSTDEIEQVELNMVREEEWEKITSVVGNLHKDDQELFHHLRQGKSLQEIARDIGISYENARQRKHRLLQRLQGLVKK